MAPAALVYTVGSRMPCVQRNEKNSFFCVCSYPIQPGNNEINKTYEAKPTFLIAGLLRFSLKSNICKSAGSRFDDETFVGSHTGPGLLSSANSGPNTNGCQFFITCAKTDWLDGKHVVFGRVLGDGMLVMRKLEAVATGQNNRPRLPCTITECGEM
jgi:hypothetical protein